MLHGQKSCFWSFSILEQPYRILDKAFQLVEGVTFAISVITRAMSRCFPFPPPGYEKKARLDDTNLLTKEKPKEKKRKDKKDKEKSERKEKKDKGSSEEKQKERKDRKEKHKDRKDKDRDKEKKRTSDEKKIELGKRIRDEGGARENEMVQKSAATEQRKAELPRKVVENHIGNSAEGKEKYKRQDDKRANGQTDKVEARGMESAAVQNCTKMDQERVEGVVIPVDNDAKKQREGKKRNKDKDNDSRGDRNKDKERGKKKKSKNKDRDKEREKKEKAKEKESNKENPESRESCKDSLDIHNIKPSYLLKENKKSSTSDGNLGKRKEQAMNGFLHDSDTRPNKLSKPVSSFHQDVELGRKLEPCQTTLQFASESPGAANNLKVESKVSCSHPALENGRKLELHQLTIHSASQMQGTTNNHVKDNKETRINGSIQAQQPNVCSTRPLFVSIHSKAKVEASVRPPHHKVDNKVSSSHPVLENGKKLEVHQLPIQSTSEMQGAVNNHKKENKEPKINGSIAVQQPNVCSMKPLSAPVKAKAKVAVKPPHPDSKYLSQILYVPKIEAWSDFDDQDWLFGNDNLQLKKPKLDSSKVDGTPNVWDEVLRMESADVTALPYVIPY
ncbi:uncharacterized protein LOC132306635 isoform X2 [Cornus florida]|uniref:uncharacterized protein LOC132306635 isoform X2 n=1 Tax=Cornus florida TaxID=4283 RepID=UPI00289D2F1C|nr:uncharacterized protein LOC132306635 isoform X2 [Cornus florida]